MVEPVVIATIKKNARETIRVTLEEYQGHMLFNAKVFYDAGDGEMRPGKAGLAFKVDKLVDFTEAVSLALENARARGLVK